MRFDPLEIPGVFLVEPRSARDERGHFRTFFDESAFAEHGLCTRWAVAANALNLRRGIVRGLHYQAAPCAETKLVRCARGALFDVVVDLRRDSPAFGRSVSVELRAEDARSLYVAAGCAHGYQVLEDGSEVEYLISAPFRAELQRGIRWDDPTLGVRWPLPRLVQVSARDAALPWLDAPSGRKP